MYSITEHVEPSVNSKESELVDFDDLRNADGRSTRWAAHRAARRADMLHEIRTVIHESGPDLSMDEIAARLRTSKSVVYRYFGDKSRLQAALGEYILFRARTHIAEASRSSRDPRRAIASMVDTYLDIVARSRNVFVFVTRPSSDGTLRTFIDQVEDLVAAVLRQVTDDVDPVRLRLWAAAGVGLVRAASEEWTAADAATRPSREQLSADLTTMLWDGTHALIVNAR